MRYRPCTIPLPPSLDDPKPIIPTPARPVLARSPNPMVSTSLNLPTPALDPPNRPTIEHLENVRLTQQNESLRDLLEKTNYTIISARPLLRQLTLDIRDLVVNSSAHIDSQTRDKIKQSIMELNEVLNDKSR